MTTLETLSLKKVGSEIVKPLTSIFNPLMSTGIVPEKLKTAEVIPIYKNLMLMCFQIIVQCHFYHVFLNFLKGLYFDRCVDYSNTHEILNEKQFGFRPNHSTYMAIAQLVDKVNTAVEKNETTIGIFLNLSKAFHTIDDKILLHKLEHYGFHGIVLQWFENYLTSTTQYVYNNNCKSDQRDIVCGVPQESILGPLLFILYVNDITYTSNALDFILFTDDTTILYSHKDIKSKVHVVNEELKEVSNWFKANILSVNASKTSYMILGTPQMTGVKNHEDFNVTLNDTILERVKFTKFLGVLIDECLTWKKHFDCVSKTISRNIGVMKTETFYSTPNITYTLLYLDFALP